MKLLGRTHMTGDASRKNSPPAVMLKIRTHFHCFMLREELTSLKDLYRRTFHNWLTYLEITHPSGWGILKELIFECSTETKTARLIGWCFKRELTSLVHWLHGKSALDWLMLLERTHLIYFCMLMERVRLIGLCSRENSPHWLLLMERARLIDWTCF
jgi:hypothetical protein